MNGIRWGGWIQGREDQLKELRSLGVKGKLRWSRSPTNRPGVFEGCVCNEATMFRLVSDWPGFKPRTFTGYFVNNDYQLRPKWQKFWRLN